MNPGKLLVCAAAVVMLTACTSSAERQREEENATRGAESYTELGVEYFRQGNYELSRTKLEKALELKPDFPQAHGAIAVLYEKVGEPELAEKHYKKALRLNPDNPREENNYGQFLCFQERYKEANKQFMKAAKNPFYASPQVPYTNAGLCAKRIPDAKQAELFFRQALQIDPKFAPALLQMAIVKFESGQFLGSRAYLERFQQVAEHNPSSLWLAVQTEHALRDPAAAGRYAILLRKNFPKSEQAIMLLEWESERRSGR
ncbi:MAG TPA: type IV pilus biogenesis/stability protein PilW [Gammaproteobacteria bacterium]|nr:type IV pilus biogenesis/stability protein PilW [Gammaproteobacteria bacterium]